MGNPSNWVSELRKVDFGLFEIFFEKSCIFGEKTKKKNLLILFASECPKTHPRHKLPLFLSHKPIKWVEMAKTRRTLSF